MIDVHPVADVRAAESALIATLPEGALMQRAAAGLAAHCLRVLRRGYGARVVLLVGAGDNGGDALFAGARLRGRGVGVEAVLLPPHRAHPAGLAAFRRSGGRLRPAEPAAVAGADLVVDGIVGIGGHGGLRPDAAALVDAAARSDAVRLSVDLPSGVDADTGAVDGAVFDADVTVTFGCVKPGLVVGAGAQHTGDLKLVDIGLRPHLPAARLRALDGDDVAALLPMPGPGADKYARGVLGVVAGSPTYGGAAVLCVGAGLHAGAGMVRYCGRAAAHVRASWPEAVVSDGRPSDAGRVQAWAVGPGLGTDDDARALLRDVLASDVPVLVDADGITLLAERREWLRARTAATLVTPHDREFERLAGEIGPDRVAAARRAAAELGVVVLLKGNATVVAEPGGRAFVNRTGTPWLAAAGTGDVLSGCVGALLAGGLEPVDAAAAGAYLHGVAGDLAADGAPLRASDVITALPAAARRIRSGADHARSGGRRD